MQGLLADRDMRAFRADQPIIKTDRLEPCAVLTGGLQSGGSESFGHQSCRMIVADRSDIAPRHRITRQHLRRLPPRAGVRVGYLLQARGRCVGGPGCCGSDQQQARKYGRC
jgi:hypothetical protein